MIATPAHEIPLPVRRKAVAVHEAGHALVAILLKRKVSAALLRPPHGLSGETLFESAAEVWVDLNIQADRRFVEDAIVILLAGQVAEAEYWRSLAALYTPHVTSHRTDDAEINALRAQLGFSHEQDAMLVGYCAERARRIVLNAQSQAAIEEIATLLAGNLSVARPELDDILHRHAVVRENFGSARHPWRR